MVKESIQISGMRETYNILFPKIIQDRSPLSLKNEREKNQDNLERDGYDSLVILGYNKILLLD